MVSSSQVGCLLALGILPNWRAWPAKVHSERNEAAANDVSTDVAHYLALLSPRHSTTRYLDWMANEHMCQNHNAYGIQIGYNLSKPIRIVLYAFIWIGIPYPYAGANAKSPPASRMPWNKENSTKEASIKKATALNSCEIFAIYCVKKNSSRCLRCSNSPRLAVFCLWGRFNHLWWWYNIKHLIHILWVTPETSLKQSSNRISLKPFFILWCLAAFPLWPVDLGLLTKFARSLQDLKLKDPSIGHTIAYF